MAYLLPLLQVVLVGVDTLTAMAVPVFLDKVIMVVMVVQLVVAALAVAVAVKVKLVLTRDVIPVRVKAVTAYKTTLPLLF
jgi:hypothetical protein